jgi:hypothetical protein
LAFEYVQHFFAVAENEVQLNQQMAQCEVEAFAAEKEAYMLWTIFVILVILWLLGLVSGHTIGGYIHILAVIAIVVVLIRIIQGRKPF